MTKKVLSESIWWRVREHLGVARAAVENHALGMWLVLCRNPLSLWSTITSEKEAENTVFVVADVSVLAHNNLLVVVVIDAVNLGTTMVSNGNCGFGLGGEYTHQGDCYDGEFCEMFFHSA